MREILNWRTEGNILPEDRGKICQLSRDRNIPPEIKANIPPEEREREKSRGQGDIFHLRKEVNIPPEDTGRHST